MKKILAILALAFIMTGCSSGFIRSKVEGSIRSALPKYIGPAKEYSVKVDGSGSEIMNGLIHHLHIGGTDVLVDNKVTLSQISIDMDDIRYNNKRQLTAIRNTGFKVSITEDAVNRCVTEGPISEYNLKVKLTDGHIQVDCVPTLIGMNMPVSITGKPKIERGNKVSFVVVSASAGDLPVPSELANRILKRLNPLIDTSKFKFPVTLNDIAVKQGCMDISGNAQFTSDMLKKP